MEEFVAALKVSIEENHFVKLTLSKCAPKASDLKNIYVRRIELKGATFLSFTYRYLTKDVVKNHDLEAALEELYLHLGKGFLVATLLTTQEDIVLQFNKKRKTRLQYRKATTTRLPDTSHNKNKQYLIEEDASFLQKLGLASDGRVLKAHQDKYRQINKYVEIMEGLLAQAKLASPLQVVDMGCGKGYLTFALYDYISNQTDFDPKVVGIELREHLTNFCTKQAKALNWNQLSFVAQDIFDYDNDKIDVLIALHACDIATDIAIAKGIQAKAALIVTAPCCHKQVRKEMQTQNALQGILKHGILEERQAEIVTDGIRALLLEAHGYETKVFEFISSEHTAKNLMITAVKRENIEAPNPVVLEKVAALKREFGIKIHYLEKLLF